MATTEQYLRQLQKDKEELIANLRNSGIDVSENATFRDISTTPLSTNVLNGVIRKYKAYAEENEVTISPNTFIEFVIDANPTLFNAGKIKFIDQFDENTIFILYLRSVTSSTRYITGALITINNTITINSQLDLKQVYGTYDGKNTQHAFYKHSTGYLLVAYGLGIINVTINNGQLEMSNALTITNSYNYRSIVPLYEDNSYFAISYIAGGSSLSLQIVKLENNVLSYIGNIISVGSWSSVYALTGGSFYVKNNKLIGLASQNSTTKCFFYDIGNDGTLTLAKTVNLSSQNNITTYILNDILYVFYTFDGVFAKKYTIDYENNNLIEIGNTSLLELNTYYQFNNSYLEVIDNYFYILYNYSSSGEKYLMKINQDLQITSNVPLQNFTTSIEFFTSELAIGIIDNNFVYAQQSKNSGGSLINKSDLYNISIDTGTILQGKIYVKESETVINGITKTESTNTKSGEIYILNN